MTFQLQATYNFSVPKATEITPNFSWLSNVLYESEFESQLWMLYNGHKQVRQSLSGLIRRLIFSKRIEETILHFILYFVSVRHCLVIL